MLTTFYAAFAPLSFTVLGLWLVVVQTRHADWSRSREHRRMAYAVSLLFALPGLMGLLSLVDPTSKVLWRVAFAAAATVGVVVFVGLGGGRRSGFRRSRLGELAYWTAIVLYLLVAVIAIVPTVLTAVGISLAALRVEAILVSLIVSLGVNLVWLLMFETASRSLPGARPAHPG